MDESKTNNLNYEDRYIFNVCFVLRACWAGIAPRVDRILGLLKYSLPSWESGMPLTAEQIRLLCPETMQDTWSFFIELNRDTDAIQKLARLIAKSNLPQKRKEAFSGRLTCAAKNEAWEYIIFNKMRLPVLIPARYPELPTIDPDELSKLAKEVERHSNAFLAELQGMRRPETLVSLQKALYPPMITCLRLRPNIPDGTEKEYYSAFSIES